MSILTTFGDPPTLLIFEIHQHCLYSILFCATLWPSPQELRGSITLCGAILGDLQHLQNLRHVITAQPGTGLLFLGNYLAEKAENEVEAGR
jgi:hypothetical protein